MQIIHIGTLKWLCPSDHILVKRLSFQLQLLNTQTNTDSLRNISYELTP